jgi:hypothetical protein
MKKYFNDRALATFSVWLLFVAGCITTQIGYQGHTFLHIVSLVISILYMAVTLRWLYSLIKIVDNQKEAMEFCESLYEQRKLDWELIDKQQELIVKWNDIPADEWFKIQEGLKKLIAERKEYASRTSDK